MQLPTSVETDYFIIEIPFFFFDYSNSEIQVAFALLLMGKELREPRHRKKEQL